MDTQLALFLGLTIVALAQALVLAMKLNQGRVNKKKPYKPENPSHSERIATLEEAVRNIKDDIEKIWEKLNRK